MMVQNATDLYHDSLNMDSIVKKQMVDCSTDHVGIMISLRRASCDR